MTELKMTTEAEDFSDELSDEALDEALGRALVCCSGAGMTMAPVADR